MKILSPSLKFAAAVTVVAALGADKIATRPLSSEDKQHLSSQSAKLTLLNGESRTVLLDGVGCTSSMCSRVSLDSRSPDGSLVTKTWLDSVSVIEDVTKDDALFLFRDGTQRRLSVIPLNRVLYIKGQWADEKIDLASVRSVEFTDSNSK